MKKFFSVIISVTLAISVNVTEVVNACNQRNSDFSSTVEEYLLNPNDNKYYPVRDLTNEFEQISLNTPRDLEFERKFENKRKNEEKEEKSKKLSGFHELISFDRNSSLPIPGGVGYGVYYNSNFQYDFTYGTTLSYDIICPTQAGGDVNNYLYLTGTNRAAKGVEAFISYYGQNDFHFRVYDWALPESDRWTRNISYSALGDYLSTKTISGSSRQIISIQNRTVQVSNNQWENIVWLWNYSTLTYDKIYYSDDYYYATLADQKDSYYGSWGPIVETFQDYYYYDTNVVGFYLVQLMSKNNSSSWSSWELLTTDNSYTMPLAHGFSTVFSTPNHTFGVH